ncbi:MAG: sigma-70 family RNA polymerase sigma factor [Holophagales bacterium]|nr:sigma-70 family RNA polymerase sigma factor [Holophagales bacterium]
MGKASEIADLAWQLKPQSEGREAEKSSAAEARAADARWIEQWRLGIEREEAAEQLYERHAGWVFHFFRRAGLREGVCQELVQETFCQAFEGLETFRGEASFKTWLHQIAINKARHLLRRRGTQKRTGKLLYLDAPEHAEDNADALLPSGPEPTPEEELIDTERLRYLRGLIESLPSQQKALVRLKVDQGRSVKEVAELLGIPVGTVKSRWSDLRKKLRRKLAIHYPGLRSREGGDSRK